MTELWKAVAQQLTSKLTAMEAAQMGGAVVRANQGQRESLRALAARLPRHGAIVADEVGMGKTRIATELTESVVRCGGRVAILIPAGLGFQWKHELLLSQVATNDVLRSVVGLGQCILDSNNDRKPWAQKVMMVSHTFGKWRIKENAHPVRWCLLPALVAVWHDHANEEAKQRRIRQVEALPQMGKVAIETAKTMAATPTALEWPWRKEFTEFCDQVTWASLMRPSDYAEPSEHRTWLRRVIGLYMGRFDMVVIDEAHKSRSDQSSLSDLLEKILWLAPFARRLAMTATPVELDAKQWLQSLDRIGVRDPKENQSSLVAPIKQAIETYESALRNVRTQWRNNESVRSNFAEAARHFQDALSTYVLRRDKNSDDAVTLFRENGGDHYRNTTQTVVIATDELEAPWKRALCAAESLSVIHVPEDHASKRMRLTFASGHGSSTFLDGRGDEPPTAEDKFEDSVQNANEVAVTEIQATFDPVVERRDAKSKRKDRLEWWRRRLDNALRQVPDSRYQHPAVQACVTTIEARTSVGDKVLVFGTYTEPMRTLVHMLNARQMLRSLLAGDYWPQSGLGDATDGSAADFLAAVNVAYQQWQAENGAPYPIAREKLDAKLENQFDAEHDRRDSFRKSLINNLRQGFIAISEKSGASFVRRYLSMLDAIDQAGGVDAKDNKAPVPLVARALLDQTGGRAQDLASDELAKEFLVLVDATLDQDQQDDVDNDNLWDTDDADEARAASAVQKWTIFRDRLVAEYSALRGGFARLMYGATSTDTRRRIQQSFNRPQTYPMVVVAQSRVGREGLNLHRACSVVLLMHPEWNPAVVEQQIGRVDRVNSLWSRRLTQAIEAGSRGEALPRIEVLPVVFRGTYDEHQWNVLNERWADLRAQLHGEVIPPGLLPSSLTPDEHDALQFLKRAAPSFSP